MAVTVLIRAADHGEEPLALTLDAPRIVIGRGKGCEIQLPDPTVSARHASLRLRGGENLIIDEGSTNGIAVGSVRLPPQTPRALRDGDSPVARGLPAGQPAATGDLPLDRWPEQAPVSWRKIHGPAGSRRPMAHRRRPCSIRRL